MKFSRSAARRIASATRETERRLRNPSVQRARYFDCGDDDGYPCINVSGATIPSYAILKIAGVNEDGAIKVTKPDATFDRIHAVNSGEEIAAGESGTCYLDGVRKVRTNEEIERGDSVGAIQYSWLARRDYPGWTCLDQASPDEENNTGSFAWVLVSPTNSVIGTLSQSLEHDGETNVMVWFVRGNPDAGPGIVLGTSLTLTTRDWLLGQKQTIITGSRVICQWVGGVWIISSAECL